MRNDISLELASQLTEQVKTAFENGSLLDTVTPVTQDLLKFWFMEPYTEERSKNFHEGQKQSILNIIYLHEVLQVTTVEEIYRQVAPDLLAECNLSDLAKEKYRIPKYAVKMATGTGKTWVMHALLLWQLLNARHEEQEERPRPSRDEEVLQKEILSRMTFICIKTFLYLRLIGTKYSLLYKTMLSPKKRESDEK